MPWKVTKDIISIDTETGIEEIIEKDSVIFSPKDLARNDMSDSCGFNYFDYWEKANSDFTMSQEEFIDWFDKHCGQCKYMGEICLYDEIKEAEGDIT